MAKLIITNIDWDTDNDYSVKRQLPKRVIVDTEDILYPGERLSDLDEYELDERLADYLSDNYGFCMYDFSYDLRESYNRKRPMAKLIKESWLKDFDKLDKWEKSKVRNELLNSNVDVENEDFEEVHFNSNRDPELKKYLNNGFFSI